MSGRRSRAAVFCALGLLSAPALPASADDGVLASFDYEGGSSLKAAYGALHLVIDSVGATSDAQSPRLRAFTDDKLLFVMRLDATPGPNASARAEIARLGGPVPQVVFQHFTGGAHCCMETKIATTAGGDDGWVIVDAPAVEGDGGYLVEDIGGRGVDELVGRDDSFLSRFGPYASSVAPLKIQTLDRARLIDVTADPRFRPAVADDLAKLEKTAEENDLWNDNGFLAGWVATKILLGEGRAAWGRMLEDYDRDPDVELNVCADPVPEVQCRKGRMRPADFPEALRVHLLRTGYIKDATAYALPPAKARDRSR